MTTAGTGTPAGRWQSLRWRLPLIISVVTTAILAVLVFAARNEVESALVATSGERARAAASQVASIFENSLRGNVAQTRAAADAPAIRAYFTSPSPENLAAVTATVSGKSANWKVVILWDTSGVSRAVIDVPSGNEGSAPALPPLPPPTDEENVQLQPIGDGSYLRMVTAITDPQSATRLGFLDVRSGYSVTPADLFSRLVGNNAFVLLGNQDGSLWIDLASLRRHATAGTDTVTGVADIGGTPLRIMVGFPRAAIVAPARGFLARMALFGLVVAIGSALIFRALTVRVTQPLLSEDIATGVETARVQRESEERLNYTLSAARVGTWEMELHSGVMRWSDTMGPLFGVQPDLLPAMRDQVTEFIHPEDREEVTTCLLRDVGDRREHEILFRALQPDGSYKWIDGRSRVTESGGQLRLVGVCIDVTEQKKLEAQLRQAQKMDAIGRLAGGVAHDFNNLLTAILGFGTFLHDDLPAGDPRREQMQEILKAARRAADLTAQLLAFSRQQLVQPVIVDVNAAVQDITGMLKRLIGENIRLTTRLAPQPATVRTDPVQLQQILMNLSINARDAMPAGGELTIETAHIDLDHSYRVENFQVVPGRYVMLAVTDTGVGMTPEVQRRLFEPFFTTKRRGEGTGLGLATVYGAIKQAGGYIWAYGEPGKGSSFKVYLPRVDGEAVPDAPPVTAAAAVGHETILMVEDEAAVRLLTRTILERAGYRVIEATSAEDAEAKHREIGASIGLLLTDVVLPGSSGAELYQRLAQLNPRLKVVYMSGYTDDTVFRTGGLEHGVAFIQKPFNADALRRKIRDVLDA